MEITGDDDTFKCIRRYSGVLCLIGIFCNLSMVMLPPMLVYEEKINYNIVILFFLFSKCFANMILISIIFVLSILKNTPRGCCIDILMAIVEFCATPGYFIYVIVFNERSGVIIYSSLESMLAIGFFMLNFCR